MLNITTILAQIGSLPTAATAWDWCKHKISF